MSSNHATAGAGLPDQTQDNGAGPHRCDFNLRYDEAKKHPEHQSCTLSGSAPPYFIPRSYVKKVLLPKSQIAGLLEEFQLPGPGSGIQLAALVKAIYEHCSTVFCILIVIGQPQHIERFVQNHYRDVKLPFSLETSRLTLSASQWEDFQKEQAVFVPHTIEKSGINPILDGRLPFPYITCEEIGKDQRTNGRHRRSRVWKVRVHREYDQLRQEHSSSSRKGSYDSNATATLAVAHDHEYALKAYTGEHAEKRQTAEVSAFEAIRGRGTSEWPPGLIQYYGAYCISSGGMRCIWLELATGGTLEELLNTAPPIHPDELCDFWLRMFELTQGLAALHGLCDVDASHTDGPRTHSMHLDIHPRNVLLVRDSHVDESRHECTHYRYKLADLGHSSTVTTNDDGADTLFLDTKAGREYSAPEVFEMIEIQGRFLRHVTARADVFPLGALLLMSLIWSVQGSYGVKMFARARQQDCSVGPQKHARFHTAEGDRSSLLPSVEAYFAEQGAFTSSLRADDSITPKLLRFIRGMLEPSPRHRWESINAAYQAERLTEDLRPKNDIARLPPIDTHGHMIQTPTPVPTPAPTRQSSVRSPQNNVEASLRYRRGRIVSSPPNPATREPSSQSAGEYNQDSQLFEQVLDFQCDGDDNSTSDFTVQDSRPQVFSSDSKRPNRQAVSLHEAAGWRNAHKKNRISKLFGRIEPLRDDHLMNEVGNQDFVCFRYRQTPHTLTEQIFLVDDSKTMGIHHRDEVVRAFTTLSYIIKNKDKDGVELRYTISGDSLQEKDTTRMIANLRAHNFYGSTNMKTSLEGIIRRHRDSIVAGNKSPSRTFKGISIVVLTDGYWAPDLTVDELIIDTAKFMAEHNLDRKALSISFVSFGLFRKGIDSMVALDDLFDAKRSVLDFVDHEPITGDVYKMLLGGYDAGYDAEDDTASGYKVHPG